MSKRLLLTICLALLAVAARAAQPAVGREASAAAADTPAVDIIPGSELGNCGPQGNAPCPKPGESEEEKAPGAAAKGQGKGLIAVGSPAAPFSLPDLTGKSVAFEPKKGATSLLLVYWSIFCEPCKEELPMYGFVAEKYAPQGLNTLAINMDGAQMTRAISNYLRINQLTLKVLLDKKEGKRYLTADKYGVTGTPTLILIGPDGTVQWTHSGRVEAGTLEGAVQKALPKG